MKTSVGLTENVRPSIVMADHEGVVVMAGAEVGRRPEGMDIVLGAKATPEGPREMGSPSTVMVVGTAPGVRA